MGFHYILSPPRMFNGLGVTVTRNVTAVHMHGQADFGTKLVYLLSKEKSGHS